MSIQQNKLTKVGEDVILLTMHGDQTPQTVQDAYEEMIEMIATMPVKKPSVLVDTSDMGTHTMAVRTLAKELIPLSPVRRVAIIGTTLALKVTINLIVRSMRTADHIRVMQSREEALSWLDA